MMTSLSYSFLHVSLVFQPENGSPGLQVVFYKLGRKNSGYKKLHTHRMYNRKQMCKWNGSGKDSLLSPLLGKDGAGLVLGVWVIGQLGRAGGHGTF